mmetsp:Transcript_27960/g.74803  ORF Transcript_27960/g.74803 Transcript_27960/m.74803 type:complete len:373 (+) Transcript_27960:497-1615(+)
MKMTRPLQTLTKTTPSQSRTGLSKEASKAEFQCTRASRLPVQFLGPQTPRRTRRVRRSLVVGPAALHQHSGHRRPAAGRVPEAVVHRARAEVRRPEIEDGLQPRPRPVPDAAAPDGLRCLVGRGPPKPGKVAQDDGPAAVRLAHRGHLALDPLLLVGVGARRAQQPLVRGQHVHVVRRGGVAARGAAVRKEPLQLVLGGPAVVSEQWAGHARAAIAQRRHLWGPFVHMRLPLVRCPLGAEPLRHGLVPQEKVAAAAIVRALAEPVVPGALPRPHRVLVPVAAVVVDVQGAHVSVLGSQAIPGRRVGAPVAHAHVLEAAPDRWVDRLEERNLLTAGVDVHSDATVGRRSRRGRRRRGGRWRGAARALVEGPAL